MTDQPLETAPSASRPAAAFRDPTRLTRVLVGLLCVAILVDVIALLSGGMQYNLLMEFKANSFASTAAATAAAKANDMRQRLVGITQVCSFLAAVIVFCMWIYRANVNARQLGAQGMRFTPAWSVGWYFIPFANLWKPYQAMKEIWQASQDPAHWLSVRPTALLGWWWALFLIAGILGNASFRVMMGAKQLDMLIVATSISAAADIASIISTLVAIALVRRIAGFQRASARG